MLSECFHGSFVPGQYGNLFLTHTVCPLVVRNQLCKWHRRMDCEWEGRPQRAGSRASQDPEGLPEAGDDGLSESFLLLQMDVEYDPQEKRRPANSAAWSSVGVSGSSVLRLIQEIKGAESEFRVF